MPAPSHGREATRNISAAMCRLRLLHCAPARLRACRLRRRLLHALRLFLAGASLLADSAEEMPWPDVSCHAPCLASSPSCRVLMEAALKSVASEAERQQTASSVGWSKELSGRAEGSCGGMEAEKATELERRLGRRQQQRGSMPGVAGSPIGKSALGVVRPGGPPH